MRSFRLAQIKGAKQIIGTQGFGKFLKRSFRRYSLDPDLEIKNAVKTFTKDYDIFVDIGAAIGTITLTVASNFSKCLCFEPERSNYKELQKKITENNFKNIKVFNFALGNEKSKKEFFISPKGKLDNRFSIHQDENFDSYEVEIEKLDEVLKSQNITKKCLIKIDVQGFEFNVMKGAKQTLENNCVIISEFWLWAMRLNNTEPSDYVDYMKKMGYGFFDLKNRPLEKGYLEKLCSTKNKKFVHDDFIIKK